MTRRILTYTAGTVVAVAAILTFAVGVARFFVWAGVTF